MLKLLPAAEAVIAQLPRVRPPDVHLELPGGQRPLAAVGAVVGVNALVHAAVHVEGAGVRVRLTADVAGVPG